MNEQTEQVEYRTEEDDSALVKELRCKQPATNLWTTRASQGKKTLTNPYDRSLIALS